MFRSAGRARRVRAASGSCRGRAHVHRRNPAPGDLAGRPLRAGTPRRRHRAESRADARRWTALAEPATSPCRDPALSTAIDGRPEATANGADADRPIPADAAVRDPWECPPGRPDTARRRDEQVVRYPGRTHCHPSARVLSRWADGRPRRIRLLRTARETPVAASRYGPIPRTPMGRRNSVPLDRHSDTGFVGPVRDDDQLLRHRRLRGIPLLDGRRCRERGIHGRRGACEPVCG